MSYTFNREFALAANEGSSQKAQNLYVIAHETANPTATGRNEATFMKRNWRNAYTQFIIGDGGIIYLIGEPGYVAYGALSANPYSPVQIELQHTKDKTMFRKNYAAYIWLIRWACDKYNIPKTLDTGKAGTKGVKSHKWVSDNIEGDHQDPYSYLASMGISKSQFARDIANGVNQSMPTTTKNTRARQYIHTFWYTKNSSGHKAVVKYCKDHKWSYKEYYSKDKKTVKIVIGTFGQNSTNKFDMEKWLGNKNYHYIVTTDAK